MTLRDYQFEIELNNLYEVRFTVGTGETLTPRISSIGGLVKVYCSEDEPTGLTLANIATKMAVAGDNIGSEYFRSIPNYIVVVQKTGATTDLILTGILIERDLGIIS